MRALKLGRYPGSVGRRGIARAGATLLYNCPDFRLPLTLLCPYPLFGYYLPCGALIFLWTYPAVPLSPLRLPLTLLSSYPALRLPLILLCPAYFLCTGTHILSGVSPNFSPYILP